MVGRGTMAMGRMLLAGVLAVGAVPPAEASNSVEDAVRAFRKAYDTPSARVRKKAVGLLEEVPGAAATEALLPALDDEDASVRERARAVLAARVEDADLAVLAERGLRDRAVRVRLASAAALLKAGAGAAPHAGRLADALKDRESTVRETAAAALGATGHRGQASVVAAALKGEKAGEVRGALLASLAVLDPEAGREAAIRTVLRDRDGPPCTAALRILAADPDAARPAAAGLLRHDAWEVRAGAADLLARCRTEGRAALEAMVDALGKEERLRVREALGAALERLTGAPLGTDGERWETWWEKEKSRWTVERIPPEMPPVEAGEGGSVARFYDLPVDGDRVVFVLDTSKSMNDAARLGEEATKLELAIAQCAGTFAKLQSPLQMNVIAFGTEVEAWRPRTLPASPGAKHDALRFLQKRQLEGRTNIHDALARALEDPEVDTVFLLTDGAPSAGEETSRDGFLRSLAWLRRWRPVRVHCVEIGAGNTGSRWKGFLADVAASTGGRSVSR